MVIGCSACLKAGGAYLPLDPGYPRERLAYMIEDARPKLILTQEALRERLPGRRRRCASTPIGGAGRRERSQSRLCRRPAKPRLYHLHVRLDREAKGRLA